MMQNDETPTAATTQLVRADELIVGDHIGGPSTVVTGLQYPDAETVIVIVDTDRGPSFTELGRARKVGILPRS